MPKGDNLRKLSDADIAEAIRVYTTPNPDGTWTGTTTIGRQFGVTPRVIVYHLQRNAINIRSPKERFANGKACKPITNLPKGNAPLCKCGCGARTKWDRRNSHWRTYARGHYRTDAPYKHKDWLNREYTRNKRTLADIAAECGVNSSIIRKFMRKFGIPARTTSESLIANGSMQGENNPAWKGGIAQWEYSHDWKRVARQIRKRDNYTCRKCGEAFPKSSKSLHVHHIDLDRSNNNPDNLITLCAACHSKAHVEIRHS